MQTIRFYRSDTYSNIVGSYDVKYIPSISAWYLNFYNYKTHSKGVYYVPYNIEYYATSTWSYDYVYIPDITKYLEPYPIIDIFKNQEYFVFNPYATSIIKNVVILNNTSSISDFSTRTYDIELFSMSFKSGINNAYTSKRKGSITWDKSYTYYEFDSYESISIHYIYSSTWTYNGGGFTSYDSTYKVSETMSTTFISQLTNTFTKVLSRQYYVYKNYYNYNI